MQVTYLRPFMHTRASRGIVKNFNPAPNSEGIEPPNSYKAMETMWKRDEVIATAFDTTVDMVTRNGWDFVKKDAEDSNSYDSERKKAITQFEELNFSEVLDNLLYQMISYGDAFLELRRIGGTLIDEFHPLETTEMRIKYNAHGKVNGYIQIPSNYNSSSSSKASATVPGSVNFSTNSVIHFRMKWMGSRLYSETPMEPISRIWATKQNAFNYLDQMFMNLHPELFIHLRGANKDQFMEVQETLWRAKTQPAQPILTYGAADSSTDIKESTANFGNTQGLFPVLDDLRNAALRITRVPPVWVNMANPGGSDKGNSEASIFGFETRVKKIQQKVENIINLRLLPLLNYQNIAFNFNPISFKSEKDAVQNAAVLHSMNVKPQGITKYLRIYGVTSIKEEDFTTPEEMMELQQSMQPTGEGNQTARNQTSPSRKPSDKSSVTNNRDQTGSSAAGSKKLEEQGMNTRSMTNFAQYPYTYNTGDI